MTLVEQGHVRVGPETVTDPGDPFASALRAPRAVASTDRPPGYNKFITIHQSRSLSIEDVNQYSFLPYVRVSIRPCSPQAASSALSHPSGWMHGGCAVRVFVKKLGRMSGRLSVYIHREQSRLRLRHAMHGAFITNARTAHPPCIHHELHSACVWAS